MMFSESFSSSLQSLPNPSAAEAKAQFLRLNLVSDTTALLPAKQVTQVLTIATDRVASIPHMAPWLIGAYNYHGEILLLVDLGHLMGLDPIAQQARSVAKYTTIVLQLDSKNSGNQLVGLVVERVHSTEQCEFSCIKTPSTAPNTDFEKLLKGYWRKSATEVLAVLDLDLVWQNLVNDPLNG